MLELELKAIKSFRRAATKREMAVREMFKLRKLAYKEMGLKENNPTEDKKYVKLINTFDFLHLRKMMNTQMRIIDNQNRTMDKTSWAFYRQDKSITNKFWDELRDKNIAIS